MFIPSPVLLDQGIEEHLQSPCLVVTHRSMFVLYTKDLLNRTEVDNYSLTPQIEERRGPSTHVRAWMSQTTYLHKDNFGREPTALREFRTRYRRCRIYASHSTEHIQSHSKICEIKIFDQSSGSYGSGLE